MRIVLLILMALFLSMQTAFACMRAADVNYSEKRKPFILKEALFIGIVQVKEVKDLGGQFAVKIFPIYPYAEKPEARSIYQFSPETGLIYNADAVWYIASPNSCQWLPNVGDIYEEVILPSTGVGYAVASGDGLYLKDWEYLSKETNFKDKRFASVCPNSGIKGFEMRDMLNGRKIICN